MNEILTEIWMILTLGGCQPLLMVVSQQLIQEINRFIRDISLVF